MRCSRRNLQLDLRLGSPLPQTWDSPAGWVAAVQRHGFRAAYWPLGDDAGADTVAAYADAAAAADIVIAEIGAWSNPLSPDEPTRAAAIERSKRRLELADRVGARCCVNLAGTHADTWDGPHPDNLSRETFDLIVDTVREIIDAVEPRRTLLHARADAVEPARLARQLPRAHRTRSTGRSSPSTSIRPT